MEKLRPFARLLMRKDSLLLKMLLSVLCIICIPLIGIQFFAISQSTDELTSKTIAQHISQLQMLSSSLTTQIDSLSTSAVKISLDADIRAPLNADISGYQLYEVAHIINKYNPLQGMVDVTAIYYPSTDRVICSGFCYTLSNFQKVYFGNGSNANGAADFLTQIEALDYFTFYSPAEAASSLKTVMIAKPVFLGGNAFAKNAVVMYIISNQTLEHWCSTFAPLHSSFAIMTDEGEFLVKGKDFTDEILSDPDYVSFASSTGQNTYRHKNFRETGTLYIKYRDTETGTTVISAVNERLIKANLDEYVLRVRWTLLLTLGLSVILVAVTIYINYAPIAQILMKHVDQDWKNSQELSELKMIDSAFFARDERINHQKDLLETFAISDLLYGHQVDQQVIDKYFPSHLYDFFVVAVMGESLSTVEGSTLSQLARQDKNLKVMITSMPYRKETILVCAGKSGGEPAELKEDLSRWVGLAVGRERADIETGGIVKDISGIFNSYREALLAYSRKSTGVVSAEKGYPILLVQNFGKQVKAGNQIKAAALLEELEGVFLQLSPFSQKYLLFDILHTYLSNFPTGVTSLSEDETEYLLSHIEKDTLYSAVRHSMESWVSASGSAKEPAISEVQSKLLNYVERNCYDSTLCLTSAADSLEISIYTVSRIFKEATGTGFKEYITAKRFERACHLLKTTKLTVSAVAEASGFENATYFSTVFKNEYGMPPSKYRSTTQAAGSAKPSASDKAW